MSAGAWSAQEFEARLRDRGRAYHIHHPFNVMLNTGKATRQQIQGWVANRFYYQINIPVKDAAILANCDDRAVRRSWVQRILDHDGYGDDPGGIDSWLRLAEAVCASLTELFAPEIHKQRLATWPEHYPWIDPAGLRYFQSRVSLARRDVEFGLATTLARFRSRAEQERALAILQFKLDVLWQMNDALALAYGVNS